jgi:hypothetical protein
MRHDSPGQIAPAIVWQFASDVFAEQYVAAQFENALFCAEQLLSDVHTGWLVVQSTYALSSDLQPPALATASDALQKALQLPVMLVQELACAA